jgi:hypothetical protein
MLGEVIMRKNNSIIFTSFIVVLISLSSFSGAAEKSHQKKDKQKPFKCHVEYQGGGDDIRFITGRYNDPNQLINYFQGRKVDMYNGRDKKIIYKVKECVHEHERFESQKARQLDKAALR